MTPKDYYFIITFEYENMGPSRPLFPDNTKISLHFKRGLQFARWPTVEYIIQVGGIMAGLNHKTGNPEQPVQCKR